MKNLHERLQECAAARGVSQSDVAQACGFQTGTVSRYFSGSSVPKSLELLKLARYFGVSMEWLLIGDEAREEKPMKVEEEAIPYSAPTKLTRQGMQKIMEALEDFQESLDQMKKRISPSEDDKNSEPGN